MRPKQHQHRRRNSRNNWKILQANCAQNLNADAFDLMRADQFLAFSRDAVKEERKQRDLKFLPPNAKILPGWFSPPEKREAIPHHPPNLLRRKHRFEEALRRARAKAAEISSRMGADKSEWRRQYNAYIHSKAWYIFRQMIFDERGHKCEECSMTKLLQLHHLHYRSFGNELPEDVKILCQICHIKLH